MPVNASDAAQTGPVRLRLLLLHAGPTFVKVGQFLSLRPDLIPQAYADELLQLLDAAPPAPWEAIRAVLEADLGPVELHFQYIEESAFAAGSLAQVHRARTLDGRELVLKILRPGIEGQIERDLRRVRLLSQLLKTTNLPLAIKPADLVAEVAIWLRREVDLDLERRHLERLGRLIVGDPTQVVPAVFPAYCRRHVLAMQRVDGIPFTQVLSVLREGGETALAARGWQIDRHRLARHLMLATLEQMFRLRFFHADVHPGNLLVLPGDVIGYVDFGMCDSVDPEVAAQQTRYLSAVYDGDELRMFRALRDILIPSGEADMERFRTDFLAELRLWRSRSTEVAGAADASPLGRWLVGTMRAARHSGFTLSPGLLSAYRTLLTAETVAFALSGESQLRLVGREFFAKLQIDELVRALSPDALRSGLPGLVRLVRDGPQQVQDLLGDLSEGRLEIKVQWTDDPYSRRAHSRRTRLLTLAVASIGLSVLLGATLMAPAAPTALRGALGALTGAVYLWMAFLWRNLD